MSTGGEYTQELESGSDQFVDFSCTCCSENEGIITEAQFYCNQCSKCFCTECVTLHNQLFKKHVVSGSGEKDVWPANHSDDIDDVLSLTSLDSRRHTGDFHHRDGANADDDRESVKSDLATLPDSSYAGFERVVPPSSTPNRPQISVDKFKPAENGEHSDEDENEEQVVERPHEVEVEEVREREVLQDVVETHQIPQVKAQYQYRGQGVTVEKGEILILVQKTNNDWWQIRKSNGSEGFVPANYVKEHEPKVIQKHVQKPVKIPEKVKAANGNALVVAAIDFGTTYSGWAFSFQHDFRRDPTMVSAKIWTGGQLTSFKGPTCILIKPDGDTLEAFADDAEARYSELSETNEHKKWYYFRRFKMALWKKSIHKDTDIKDECGRELPALTVFSLAIRFMKDDLAKITDSQAAGLKADDIHWVLTVPAIWNDSAKQFMRLAAEQAGISSDKLTLALEPEAASLYCRHLPVKKDGESSLSTLRAGQKYLVLDAGGGTIDITVHEVSSGGNLKEVHKASGGAWGGTEVDAAFMEFLGKITDKKAMQKFKDENMEDYIDLLREFEIKKRTIDTSNSGKITIKVPSSLTDHVKNETGRALKDILQSSGYGKKVTLAGDKVHLDADIMRSFFSTSLEQIVEHVSDLLRKAECGGVEAILMVGGYSECMLLQESIKQRFPKLKIIVPPEAGLAVLKGAVIYGHSPIVITERVSKYTCGTDEAITFIDGMHPWSKRQIQKDGSIRCTDIFSKLVEVGDKLVVGKAQKKELYTPVDADQKAMGVAIFATSDKNPKFTTDIGCRKIGAISVPLAGSGTKRSVKVRMIFGGTEITVECQETATGNITRLPINFFI